MSRLGDLLIAAGDAEAIEDQLAEPVMLRGIVFPTEPCRSKFQAMREVGDDDERGDDDELARCLAGLALKVSGRDSAAAGVRLVEHEREPGLELEVTFARDRAEKILAIGFVSRLEASDDLPTITQDAFEAALTQRALAPMAGALIWAKVCIDASGAVTSVRPDLVADPAGVPAAIEQVKQWRREPFVIAGAPAAVCSVLRLTTGTVNGNTFVPRVPPAGQGDALTVDEATLGPRVVGTAKIVPSAADREQMRREGRPELVGVARYCVGTDGHVRGAWTASPSGIPGWDRQLLATVEQWQYEPRSEPVCVFDEVIYRP